MISITFTNGRLQSGLEDEKLRGRYIVYNTNTICLQFRLMGEKVKNTPADTDATEDYTKKSQISLLIGNIRKMNISFLFCDSGKA